MRGRQKWRKSRARSLSERKILPRFEDARNEGSNEEERERQRERRSSHGRGGVGPRTGITSFCRWKFVKGNVKRISGDSLSPVPSCPTGCGVPVRRI